MGAKFLPMSLMDLIGQTEQDNQYLSIRCNKYNANLKSWLINPVSNQGILADQGTGCGGDEYRAGNEFNDACNIPGQHITSYLINSFAYYAWSNPGNQIPSCKFGSGDITICESSNIDNKSCSAEPPCFTPPCIKKIEEAMGKEKKERMKIGLMNEAIEAYLSIGDENSAMHLLKEKGTLEAKKLLIPTHIDRNELEIAQTELSTIPSDNEENIRYKQYYNTLIEIKNADRNLFQMNSTEEAKIREVSLSESSVSLNAKMVLESVKGEKINRIPEIENLAALKTAPGIGSVVTIETPNEPAQNLKIDDYPTADLETIKPRLYSSSPNPLQNATTIRIDLGYAISFGELVFSNVIGEKVKIVTLADPINYVVLNKQDFKSGIYFYTLLLNGSKIETRKLVVAD